MLHELVRVALKSTSVPLTLGNITAAAEVYKYLTGRLTSLHASHTPPSERVAFLYRELSERRQHEAMVGRSSGSSSVGAVDSGGGGGAGTGGASGGGGLRPQFRDPVRLLWRYGLSSVTAYTLTRLHAYTLTRTLNSPPCTKRTAAH